MAFLIAAVLVVALPITAHAQDKTAVVVKAKTDAKTKSVTIIGVLVDSSHKPIKGERVYLFALYEADKVLVEFVEGVVSNPKGITDSMGLFRIVADGTFVQKHGNFTVGLYTWNLKVERLMVNGIPEVLDISASSNLGKTIDLGTITVENYNFRSYYR